MQPPYLLQLKPPTRVQAAAQLGRVLHYWMHERENIRLKRKAGLPSPWTSDKILLTYKFCNVFRRYDRVTQHYLSWIKPLLANPANKQAGLVIFNTIMYRLFNWPPTLDAIGLVREWDAEDMLVKLTALNRVAPKLFGSAYMVTNAFHSIPKHELVVKALDKVMMDLDKLAEASSFNSVEKMTKALTRFFMIGPFLAYEIATDLTYGYVLAGAKDIDTWANAGPGAQRGLNRLHGNPIKQPWKEKDALAEMRSLLEKARALWPPQWREKLHLREIEHSLCETDKYMRALLGEGRPKTKFRPTGGKQ